MLFAAVKKLGNLRVYLNRKSVAHHIPGLRDQIPVDFVADGFAGQQMAVAVAIETGFTQGPGEVAAGPFSCHLYKAQFRKGQNIGLAFVPSHGLVHPGHDFFLMGFPAHIDEVDDNNAPDVSEPNLVGNFFYRLQVGLKDGLVKIMLAHVTAGVHVNGYQGLGLFYDDIAP